MAGWLGASPLRAAGTGQTLETLSMAIRPLSCALIGRHAESSRITPVRRRWPSPREPCARCPASRQARVSTTNEVVMAVDNATLSVSPPRILRYLIVGTIALSAALPGTADAALLAYDSFAYGTDPSMGEYVLGDESTGIGVIGGQSPVIGPTLLLYRALDPVGRRRASREGASLTLLSRASGRCRGRPAGNGAIQLLYLRALGTRD